MKIDLAKARAIQAALDFADDEDGVIYQNFERELARHGYRVVQVPTPQEIAEVESPAGRQLDHADG